MTGFRGPVFIGGSDMDTGNATTDTRGVVEEAKFIDVSANGKSATRTLPPNCEILGADVVVVSAVAGIAAGVTVRLGTAATAALYATAAVSAEAVVAMTLTKQVSNGPTTIVVDATAQASAADWTGGKFRIRPRYAIKS